MTIVSGWGVGTEKKKRNFIPTSSPEGLAFWHGKGSDRMPCPWEKFQCFVLFFNPEALVVIILALTDKLQKKTGLLGFGVCGAAFFHRKIPMISL